MPRILGSAAAAVATVFTGGVIRRMKAEYWNHETFSPATVGLMYGACAANIGAFALAVRRREWPLPLPDRTARLAGGALAAAGAVVAVGGASGFRSVPQLSGTEPGSLVVGGRYRRTRNPRYLGLVATLIGIGIAARSGLAGAIAAGAWAAFNRWIPSEDGHEYRAYAARTRRWP